MQDDRNARFNAALAEHRDLIEAAVRRQRRHTASGYETADDLRQDAMIGLANALDTFDPDNSKGASFRTYAAFRIDCGVKDGIRSRAPGTRSMRELRQQVAIVRTALLGSLGRDPSFEEIVEQIGADRQTVTEALAMSMPPILAGPSSGEDGEEAPCGLLEQIDESADMERAAAESESAARLLAHLARLPDREQELFIGYYYGGQSMRSIIGRYGIRDSYASKVRQRAERHLRACMSAEAAGEALPVYSSS